MNFLSLSELIVICLHRVSNVIEFLLGIHIVNQGRYDYTNDDAHYCQTLIFVQKFIILTYLNINFCAKKSVEKFFLKLNFRTKKLSLE